MSAPLRDPLAEPAHGSSSKLSAGLSLGLPRSKGGRSTLSPSPSAPPPSGLELRRLDEDESIRATDSDALSCRLSALKAGYFEGVEQDPYSELFSTSSSSAIPQGQSFLNPPISRRPPIINVGTFLRCTALDKLISDFLLSGDASQEKQIVSVGAGSDARYWRLQSNPALASRLSHYLELDFPSIVSKKLQAISRHSALQSHLDAEPSLRSGPLGDCLVCSRYAIQSCDLRALAEQKPSTSGKSDDGDVLQSLDPTKPTLILAECVLAYMAPEASVSLIETIASRIHPSTEVRALCYEMCLAGDAVASTSINGHQHQSANNFGKVMLSNLETRGLSLLGARAFPTTDSHAQRFQKALTTSISSSATTSNGVRPQVQSGATSLRAIWSTLPPAERERLGRVEGLDEVEELELLLSCYCISWGSRIGSQISPEGFSAQGSAGVAASSIGGDPQTQDQAGAIDDVAPVVESSR
jgi:[phosphatase 2A protein]-leucine-carboxy methyltransferase